MERTQTHTTNTYMHTHTCTHTHTEIHTRTHTHGHTHTHMDTHTDTHTHMHAHTHTDTHTPSVYTFFHYNIMSNSIKIHGITFRHKQSANGLKINMNRLLQAYVHVYMPHVNTLEVSVLKT